MDPINPADVQPGDAQLTSSDPKANVGTPAPAATAAPAVESLTLAELNELTGRQFKTKDSALKSIKDTFVFATTRVTDVRNQVEAQVATEMGKLRETVEAQNKEMFYVQNPQYAPHRKLIDSLGKNPGEVVNSDIFKDTYGKLAEHEKTVKLKTVLESNPRLASSRDNLSKAAELKQKSNGFVTEDVAKHATDAVIEAFNLRG